MDKIDLLLKNGWLILEKVYDSEKVNHLLKCAINAHEKFINSGGSNNNNGVHIEHQFIYENSFLEVVENELVCKIIEQAIGNNIILINTALDNRQILDDNSNLEEWGGTSWHTDSHYVQKGKVRLNYGFSYLAILCLDKFTEKNGATQYIENSHKVYNKPNRTLDSNIYKPKSLEANPGDIILIDTALWHRAGVPSKDRRWGMISMYGPWFVKPYFNYTKMFTKSEILNLSPNLLNLFHFTSTPPVNQIQRINTKITPEEFINEFKLS